MPNNLLYKKAISFIKEIKTEGHSPLLLIADDFNAYYVKNTKGQVPCFSIISEFICHYFLKIWDIKTPDIAAIKVEQDILSGNLSHFHKPHFYNNICFGSKKMNNIIEMNNFIEIHRKADFNKFENPYDLLKLCLFDIWVENDDRKPTNPNVLFEIGEKINIIAIDNAFTFASMSYTDLYQINGQVAQSYNDNLLYTDFVKEIVKYLSKQINLTEDIRKYFYFCIEKSKENFNTIVENIPESLGFTEDLQNLLYDFLFNEKRNKQVLLKFFSYIS